MSTPPPYAPRLAPHARLKWDRRGNRYLLLYPERGLALSESAADILRRCDGHRSVDEIIADIARARGADAGVVRRDVSDFLLEMRARGLVVYGADR